MPFMFSFLSLFLKNKKISFFYYLFTLYRVIPLRH